MGKHEAPAQSARHIRPAAKKNAGKRRAPAVKMPDFASLRTVAGRFTGRERAAKAREGKKRPRHEYGFTPQNVLLIGAGAVVFLVVSLLPARGWGRTAAYLVPLLLLGAELLRDAAEELLSGDFLGRSLMTSLAAALAFSLGEYPSAVFIVLLFRVFLMAEAYARESRRTAAAAFSARRPTAARRVTETGLYDCEPEAVETGAMIQVEDGEVIPLDGVVVDGLSSVDTSPLTGNPALVDVAVGSSVYAGCVNRGAVLRIRVTEEFETAAVNRMTRLAETAAETQPKNGQFVRYLVRLLPAVFALCALITGVVVPLFGKSWWDGLYRAALLLAVGGGSGLLLSLSLVYHHGITRAARFGILLRSADALEEFARADTMIFSKTGTITEGRYRVEAVYPERYSEKDLLTIAALAECQSRHPIAQALREACGLGIVTRDDIHLVEEINGRGVSTLFSGRNVYVGNAALMMEHGIRFEQPTRTGTVIHVSVDNEYAGHIVLSDKVRDGAFDAIEELRILGIGSSVMLTGDVRSMARPVASSLSFDLVKCELSRDAKISAVEYLQASKGGRAAIAYVSSKSEDLPVMERADVSIAFAALGSRRALEEADVTVLDSSLSRLPLAYGLARETTGRARQNLIAVMALKLLLLVLGLLGVMAVWPAVLLDCLFSAAALLNAVRD